jgi:cellulose synthase/poly-beta-1,6-N-acetylglucosamine synthase-like glycosyltransferase
VRGRIPVQMDCQIYRARCTMTMKTSIPAVSVVIPAYNRAYCVANAVESTLAQTFKDFEIIAVDDGTANDLGKFGDQVRRFARKTGALLFPDLVRRGAQKKWPV